MTPEANPRLVFERLFGRGDGLNNRSRIAERRSVLDFVMNDAKKLERRLAGADKRKLDEYLEGIRSVERRIERAEQVDDRETSDYVAPTGIPESYRDHLRAMYDLMALAFQTDLTRTATFLSAHDGSNRSFKDIEVAEGHHDLSHHQNDPDKMAKIAAIDKFYMEQFGYFLDRLNQMEDGDGESVLHHSMIVYGGCISDGNRHAHDDLPIILAGAGGGSLHPGRHVVLPKTLPLSNLYVSLLDRVGSPDRQFGDSTRAFNDV